MGHMIANRFLIVLLGYDRESIWDIHEHLKNVMFRENHIVDGCIR